MTKDEVLKHRELCKAAVFNTKDGDGNEIVLQCPITVICDNSVKLMDEDNGLFIWDDDNERIIAFDSVSSTIHKTTSRGMSFGNAPAFPISASVIDYGEIQNILVELNREGFDKFATAAGLTDEQKADVIRIYFDGTDMTKIIPRKRQVSYVTGTPNDSKFETDPYRYRRPPINPNQSGPISY